MFSFLLGGNKGGADACCGNREKVDAKNAVPLTPPPPLPSSGSDAMPGSSPAAASALMNEAQENAEQAKEVIDDAADKVVDEATGAAADATRQAQALSSSMGISPLAALGSALTDIGEQLGETGETLSSKENPEPEDERPATDGGASNKFMSSFEDRAHAQAGDSQMDLVSDDSEDSDADRLQECAKALRAGQKSLKDSMKKKRRKQREGEPRPRGCDGRDGRLEGPDWQTWCCDRW